MADEPRPALDILLQVISDAQDILRAEVRLAMAEIREDLLSSKASARLIGMGILSAMFAVFFALLGLVKALSYVLAPWAAAVLVALALAICATFMVRIGSQRMKRLTFHGKHSPQPHREP